MTPGTHCYLDKYQVDKESQSKEPLGMGSGFISVEKVYGYDPTPDVLSTDEKKYILGAQGNVWTEYIGSAKHIEYMVLPRMTALSEVVWTQKENKDWGDFKSRLNKMKERYEALGLNYAKHVFETKKDTVK